MEIHQLKYFVAVAEELHFGRAAERLLVTASPLSKQIRRLERELGGDLFVRDHHSVRLTPLGVSILPRIREILERIESLNAIRITQREQLRLGATPLAPARYLDQIKGALSLDAPELPVDITLAPTSQLLPLLEQRKLDMALVFRPIPEDRFEAFDVASHGFLVGMAADDPLAGRESVVLSDLATGTLVTATHTFHPDHLRQFRDRLRGAGINNIVEVAQGNSAVVVANVRILGARTLVPDVEHYPSKDALAGDAFSLVPLEDSFLVNVVALVALRDRLRENRGLHEIFDSVSMQFE